MKSRSLFFGLAFGFVLSRAGATDYDAITSMFRLTDLHLMGVMGVAVLASALGFNVVRRRHLKTTAGEPIVITVKPIASWLVPGALLFGAGWAIAGTCPGTAFAQLGEGKFAAVFTLFGILLGSHLGERITASREPRIAPINAEVGKQLFKD